MLRFVIEKELREIVGSAKFAATFGVCATAITGSPAATPSLTNGSAAARNSSVPS